jgi:hypothetical protein
MLKRDYSKHDELPLWAKHEYIEFESAGEWEKNILMRNVKTFNFIFGTYNTDLPEGVEMN